MSISLDPVQEFRPISFRPDFSLSGDLQIPWPWNGTERIETPVPPTSPRTNLLRPEELELLLSPDWPAIRSGGRTGALAHISILNESGTIIAVNQAWRSYAETNGLADPEHGLGMNYLEICDAARGHGAYEAHIVARGIRDVLASRYTTFRFNYPNHSPTARQWYSVRVSRWIEDGTLRLIVAHDEIR